jgi:outer membrane protein OmpA-like peptidoglycan-associated protein
VEAAVHFESGTAHLDKRARRVLDELAERAATHPRWTLSVEGHTDAVGDTEFNDWLSQQRARAVARHLRATGLPRSHLKVRGFGATRPVADGDDPTTLRRNRRVEIIIQRGAP